MTFLHVLISVLLAGSASSAAAATRGGNGGDGTRAQDFVRHAYKFISHLERLPESKREGLDPALFRKALANAWIKGVETCDATGPDGLAIPSPAACNFPDAAPPRIEVTAKWKNLSRLQKTGLAGHELAGLLGIETNRYTYTAAVMNEIESFMKHQQDHDSTLPVLVGQVFSDFNRQGFTHDEARRYCNKMRRLHLKDFFYVYCHYIKKSWKEVNHEFVEVPGYQFLGYEDIQQRTASQVAVTGIYMNTQESTHSIRPVIRRITRIVHVRRLHSHFSYGVKVYGLGIFKPNLPISQWPYTLVRSDALITAPSATESGQVHIVESIVYRSMNEALRACTLAIRTAMRTAKEKYYRSRCAIDQNSDGSWYFAIKSQNPFLHEDF